MAEWQLRIWRQRSHLALCRHGSLPLLSSADWIVAVSPSVLLPRIVGEDINKRVFHSPVCRSANCDREGMFRVCSSQC